MTEEEKFVREHWTVQRVGETPKKIYLNGLYTNSSWTAFVDWAAAAEFTRQRLEEIRRAQEVIDILSRGCDRYVPAIARILDRERKILASLKSGMKEPQP